MGNDGAEPACRASDRDHTSIERTHARQAIGALDAAW
jgi:hypothetical protein